MPNYGYHLARAQGRAVRSIYRTFADAVVRAPVKITRDFPLEVYAYSGEAALPEQIASIRSFLRFAGRPPRFTVVSDGSYSQASIATLKRINECVAVDEIDAWIPDAIPAAIEPYLRAHPTGRQLALIMSLSRTRQALYTDSDVLFFADAGNLAEVIASASAPAMYLRDCRFSGDERLLRAGEIEAPAVNTGFLLLFQQLDWSGAIARFIDLEGEPTFFTNQTMAHLAMHANGAVPLDPAKYVLQLDDQFIYADRYAGETIAMRHYVNPVRHKFWSTLASI